MLVSGLRHDELMRSSAQDGQPRAATTRCYATGDSQSHDDITLRMTTPPDDDLTSSRSVSQPAQATTKGSALLRADLAAEGH